MLEQLYKFLDQKIVATENELGAIKSFLLFALSSIVQALKLFFVKILKSIAGILTLLFSYQHHLFNRPPGTAPPAAPWNVRVR